MIYKEFEPKLLKDYVEFFWSFTYPKEFTLEHEYICPPDASIQLVIANFGSINYLPNVTLTGMGYKLKSPHIFPGITIIGVKFKPAAHINFFNHSIEKILENDIVIENNFFTSLSKTINEDFNSFNLIEFELENLLKRKLDTRPTQIASLIQESKGNITNEEISGVMDLSVRYCQKIFKKAIGITIKEYSKIYRFRLAMENVAFTNKELFQIAIDFGFYDQAHFINEIKSIGFRTPLEYRKYYSNWNFQTFRKL